MSAEYKEILEKLSEMNETLVQVKTNTEHIDGKVDRHEDAIFGNGQRGLKSEVAILKDSQKKRDKIWTAVTIAVILMLLGLS